MRGTSMPWLVAGAPFACLALAWACFLVPARGFGLYAGLPLVVLSIVLAIMAMNRGAPGAGVAIGMALLATPLVYALCQFIGRDAAGPVEGAVESTRATPGAARARDGRARVAGLAAALANPPKSGTAEQLGEAYGRRPERTAREFDGRRVVVTGRVLGVASEGDGAPLVLLAGGRGPQVRAAGLTGEQAARLRGGQTVTLDCVASADAAGPRLVRCSRATGGGLWGRTGRPAPESP